MRQIKLCLKDKRDEQFYIVCVFAQHELLLANCKTGVICRANAPTLEAHYDLVLPDTEPVKAGVMTVGGTHKDVDQGLVMNKKEVPVKPVEVKKE